MNNCRTVPKSDATTQHIHEFLHHGVEIMFATYSLHPMSFLNNLAKSAGSMMAYSDRESTARLFEMMAAEIRHPAQNEEQAEAYAEREMPVIRRMAAAYDQQAAQLMEDDEL